MVWFSKKTACFVVLFLVYNAVLFAYNRLDWNVEPEFTEFATPSPPAIATVTVTVMQKEEVCEAPSQAPPTPTPAVEPKREQKVDKSREELDKASASWECEIENDGKPHLVKLPITFEELLLRTPRVCNEENKPLHLTYDHIRSLRSKNYFIALNLYQNGDVSPHLYTQLLKVMHFISKRPRSYEEEEETSGHGVCIDRTAPTFENIYVSVYESGSIDDTPLLGDFFEEKLRLLGVAHRVILRAKDIASHRENPSVNRIDFMAQIRNRALEPLYDDADFKYDKVLFLNDIYFCWQDAIRLLVNDQIDMACGLDVGWRTDFNTFGFYDTWVSRDKTGNFINFLSPFFQKAADQDRLLKMLPVPMFCCWNGMTAINAEAFYPPHNIRFRRSPQNKYRNNPKESCDGAECSVFCFDLFKNGFMDIIIDPHVISTYEPTTFYKTAEVRSWPNDNSDRKIEPSEKIPYSAVLNVSEIPFTNKFPDKEWCCPVPTYMNGGLVHFDCYYKEYQLGNTQNRKFLKGNEN